MPTYVDCIAKMINLMKTSVMLRHCRGFLLNLMIMEQKQILELLNKPFISDEDYRKFAHYLFEFVGHYSNLGDMTTFQELIRTGLHHQRTRALTLVFLEDIFAAGNVSQELLSAILDGQSRELSEAVLYLLAQYNWRIMEAGYKQFVHEHLILHGHNYIAKLYE